MTRKLVFGLLGGLSFGVLLCLWPVDSSLAATSTNVPDPANSELEPADGLNGLVLAPDDPTPVPATINTLTVRNATNAPCAGATATVEISGTSIGGQGGIVLCASAVLTGVTNASGEVTFSLFGGGCVEETPLAATVKVSGITLRTFENIHSPDFDGSAGDLSVDLADLIDFSDEFLGASPAECHDYDNSGLTDLADLIIFSPAFLNPNSCLP